MYMHMIFGKEILSSFGINGPRKSEHSKYLHLCFLFRQKQQQWHGSEILVKLSGI